MLLNQLPGTAILNITQPFDLNVDSIMMGFGPISDTICHALSIINSNHC